MGIVCDSLIDLGKVLTVEFTSAGTLTTLTIVNVPALTAGILTIVHL